MSGLTAKGGRKSDARRPHSKEKGYEFDSAFTSVLKRAIKHVVVVLEEMDWMWDPGVRELATERAALRRTCRA